jgi:outer membrane protein assembly factor BamD (BamD/ComL family)
VTRDPSTSHAAPTNRHDPWRARSWSALVPLLLCFLTGCATGGFTPPWRSAEVKKKDDPKDAPIIQAGLTTPRLGVIDPEMQRQFDVAKDLFEQKKFTEAEPLFHKLGETSSAAWWQFGMLAPSENNSEDDDAKKKEKKKHKGPNPIAEGALYYEAECQRMQKNYREAEFTYTKVLADYPRSQYAIRVCQGLFQIADYWLEPTRRQMDQYQEQLAGKRWFVTPALYFNWGKDMPMLDAEGHAIQALNTVRLHDIKGPMGEKALLYLGTIHFFRQDYKEADFYFAQLYQEYPNSVHAAKAVKQSVICKQLMTGGSIYDCRGVEESKKLLMTAMGAYPELAKEEQWIENQLKSINIQQADRDLKIAEFYQRTGHPGAAFFYYELVCRRYPNTSYCATANQRKSDLRVQVEKEQQQAPTPTPGTADPAPAASNGIVPRLLPSLLPPARP